MLTLFLVVKSKIFFQNISVSVQQKKMFDPEQQDETYDMDNEFDCEVEKEVKTVKVKEKKNSETDCYALESYDDQSEGNGKWIVFVYPFTLFMLFFVESVTIRRGGRHS